MPAFHYMSNLKSSCDSPKSMKYDLSSFKKLLEIKIQFIAIESMILLEIACIDCKKA